MPTSEQIKILCVKLAFSQKMKREGFTPADLKDVAGAVGCGFETSFILPSGERVTD